MKSRNSSIEALSLFNICVTCSILISGYFGLTRKLDKLFPYGASLCFTPYPALRFSI